jgi:histidine phosphotransferase ChpT
MQTNAQALDYLAAKLVARTLHDVAGPTSGLTAALDLLGDTGGDGALREEALALARESLAQINEKITFCRAAFGGGGGLESRALAPLVHAPFRKGRANLEFPEIPIETPSVLKQALLILALIGAESLALGGTARIRVEMSDGVWAGRLTAEGPRARLHPETALGLDGADFGEGLPGRWAPARYLHALMMTAGGRVSLETRVERVEIRIACPASPEG